MEITKENLITGETVLINKGNKTKHLYLGCVGLAHFISSGDCFKVANPFARTIEEINENFTIEQPESKVVPLEKKSYNFVPVRVRDNTSNAWIIGNELVAVLPKNKPYPFVVFNKISGVSEYKYAEFI